MAKMGRPSTYTKKMATTICSRLACGESLRSVCRDDDMPPMKTVYCWMSQNPDFRNQYAQAKEDGADALAEEMFDIADNGTNDWMEKHDKKGENLGYVLNGEHVQRSKLRVDTRKWYLSKIKPKKYGDKITQELSGPDGKPIEVDQVWEIKVVE